MARIRSIKPEFWTSEQVMECSPNARLLFIGLWNFCDDTGRHPASAKQIKALIFPADDFSADDIRRMLVELSGHDLLSLYTVDGKEYFQITGWHHQKIDRPQAPKYPGPNDDDSPNGRRTLATEGIGEDRKGEDKTEPSGSDADASQSRIVPIDARTALFHEGLAALSRMTGKPEPACRPVLGKWLKQVGDDASAVLSTIRRAAALQVAEPISWIERVLKPADPDAAIYRAIDRSQPTPTEVERWKAMGLS
jgi:hypothetical protein